MKSLSTLRRYLQSCDPVIGKVLPKYKFLFRGIQISGAQEDIYNLDKCAVTEDINGQGNLVLYLFKKEEE